MKNITPVFQKPAEPFASNVVEKRKKQKTGNDGEKDRIDVNSGRKNPQDTTPLVVDNKGVYKLSKGQLNVKLNLEFNPKNVEDFVNRLKQDMDSSGKTNRSGELKIIDADLKVNAEEKTSTKVSEGNGNARDISVSYRRRSYQRISYRNRNVEVAMRERERVEARLDVRHRNGYRTVSKNLVQRYNQDVTVKFSSLGKFNRQVTRMSKENPEAAQKYMDTTNKLVTSEKVKGETINNFFDTVESLMNQAEKNLLNKIDTYFSNAEENFSFDKEQLAEAKKQMYKQVMDFFDKVDHVLKNQEKKALEPAPEQSEKESPAEKVPEEV